MFMKLTPGCCHVPVLSAGNIGPAAEGSRGKQTKTNKMKKSKCVKVCSMIQKCFIVVVVVQPFTLKAA